MSKKLPVHLFADDEEDMGFGNGEMMAAEMMNTVLAASAEHLQIAERLTRLIVEQNESPASAEDIFAIYTQAVACVEENSPVRGMREELMRG